MHSEVKEIFFSGSFRYGKELFLWMYPAISVMIKNEIPIVMIYKRYRMIKP